MNLENKVVLAIATRIAAERFMIGRIGDPKFVAQITKNQTAVLIDKFKEQFSADKAPIRTLGQVELMTPENIHLNSFMYEAIVDMSDEHLRKLYRDVLAI